MHPRLENDKLLIVSRLFFFFFHGGLTKTCNLTPENCVKTVIAACQLAAHFEIAQKGNFLCPMCIRKSMTVCLALSEIKTRVIFI